MAINDVELRWLTLKNPPYDRVLQSRLKIRSISGITGLEFIYTPWEDVPVVWEGEL